MKTDTVYNLLSLKALAGTVISWIIARNVLQGIIAMETGAFPAVTHVLGIYSLHARRHQMLCVAVVARQTLGACLQGITTKDVATSNAAARAKWDLWSSCHARRKIESVAGVKQETICGILLVFYVRRGTIALTM